jgi:hypothetical protein
MVGWVWVVKGRGRGWRGAGDRGEIGEEGGTCVRLVEDD